MENKYAGMTVNERLCLSGLMDEFDEGVEEKNTVRIRSNLESTELTEEAIKPILEQLGL